MGGKTGGRTMEDNPFAVLAGMLKSGNDNQIFLYQGKIVKVSPLTIDAAGITLSGNELMVNTSLLQQIISINNISGELTTYSSEIDVSDGKLTAKFVPDLKVGDTVLLLTLDQQLFYVLCKVVSV